MPGIFYQPANRRSFLKTSGLASLSAGLMVRSARGQGAASGESLHLALLSDTHIPGDRMNGHRGFNPYENLKKIIPEVVEARPDGVIVNGDAARLEGKLEDYQVLKELLGPVAAISPVYIGLGNHDDRAEFATQFKSPPALKQNVANKHVLVVEHPAVRVIVLDSLLYVNQVAGLLGSAQRQWLAEYLPRHSDRPVALFVHHTLKDGDGDLLDADKLFAIIEPHPQVKAIFYGHSHVWSIEERGGVKMINLPAVGYNFRDTEPVGWVDARFNPKGVELTLRAFGGNLDDHGKTKAVKWA